MSHPSPMKRRVPFDDFAGKPIFEGDSIRHPDGKTATVAYEGSREFGEWRAVYADGVSLWLGNQVDDRGMAVVVPTPEPAEQGAYRPLCSTCGDQGHVHRADGEYLGTCDNCTVYELSCVKHELAQAKQVIADSVEPVSANTQERRERWLLNIADAIKFGLPNYLRERLQYTEKEIRRSMKYGGTKRLRDELERVKLSLADPEAVFANMKAGKIAKPSIRSMVDLYGEVVDDPSKPRLLLEIAKLRAEIERKDEEYDKAWRHDLNDKNNVQVLTTEVLRLTAEVELLTAERDARVRQVRNVLNDSEELRQDAERHRYWRLHTESFHLTGPVSEETENRHDAFIDAAMRKELQP